MKIKEILSFVNQELNNVEDSVFKSRMLIMNILNVSKEYLLIHSEEEFPENKKQELENKILRLKKQEPIQYVINHQAFFGYDFYVDENVLIPQPDTEILVEECISILDDVENNPHHKLEYIEKNIKVLDLCTGSGAIAISIAKNVSKINVFASDVSEKALEIAKKNAKKNEAEIDFIKSDLFENIEEKFDMIISNPPYIETNVIETLSEEVKKEPFIALDGGEDGLKFYKEIAKKAQYYLEDNGYLALEIGYNQKEAVEKILENNQYKNIYSKKDLGGNDRIIIAQV